ncbi:hypothetical protein PVAND_012758 [Polypedilum vanderplanki]|uniref:Uncharacterized protein n=1 Tax=Polypedilum vanderplanki TaxID=319348 RepID=A0A9J6CNF2_POLVA|nr:hypothetical protein PVAND_012758 [Polypedilum vanderplanki]
MMKKLVKGKHQKYWIYLINSIYQLSIKNFKDIKELQIKIKELEAHHMSEIKDINEKLDLLANNSNMCFVLNDENSFILKPNKDASASADTEGLLNTTFDCSTDKLPNEIQKPEVDAPNKLDDFSGIEDVCIDSEIIGNSSDTNEEEILEKEEGKLLK